MVGLGRDLVRRRTGGGPRAADGAPRHLHRGARRAGRRRGARAARPLTRRSGSRSRDVTSARDLFVVEPGSAADLAGRDPRTRSGIRLARRLAEEDLARVHERLDRLQVRLMADDRRSLARRPAGDGHERQGRHDPARVRPRSRRRRPGDLVRRADRGGARPRLPVADPAAHARPRAASAIFNRSHYEDVVVVRVQRLAPETVWREPLRRRSTRSSASSAEGGDDRQVLPAHLEGRAARAPPRAARRPRQAVEVQPGRPRDRERWDDFQAAYEDALHAMLDRRGAVVRRPGRPQVVPQLGSSDAPRRHARGDGP